MTKEKIERINILYHKSQVGGLSPAEREEQAALREEYRAAVRSSLAGSLDQVYIAEPDGTTHKAGEQKK